MWRWRRRSENDFGEEIRANIGIDTDRFLAKGMSPEEARAAALRAFGNVTHAQERFYESRRVMWLDDLQRDLTHALRALAKNPGFTLVVVLTLALGIGANTAIFSVVNALLLRPLPYKNADRLVQLIMDVPAAESPTKRPLRAALGLSRAEMAEVGLHARTLSQVGTTGPILRGFSGHEEGARLQ